jgi:hypothetical protein
MEILGGQRQQDMQSCGRQGEEAGGIVFHKSEYVISDSELRCQGCGLGGVTSKYSGIEAYYEEVGKQLAAMGYEVTVYCRNYFTPALAEHNGMRLPTIRSKHLETVIHTLLSTMHALTQHYDVVHYHALGPALFSFLPRVLRRKTLVTMQGPHWQRKRDRWRRRCCAWESERPYGCPMRRW